ncbi:TRAM domain-containing protein [Candidatus Woesearchaeota archaeon]|nr:TRAM domain-containing protein [Candidatus Woesearchaeota archaeon]
MERRHNSGPRRGFGPKPPVNQGDVLELEIEAVGEKGDGIARKDGFVLFVPGVKEGDRVKVKVTRVLRKVGFAEVVGEGAEAPAEEASQEEMPAEPEPEPEVPAEDTEDFGEEVAEEASVEEAPAEDEVEAPEPPEEEEKTE